jgi:uncharacterized protein involved in exopolysaccharide biosynthesis
MLIRRDASAVAHAPIDAEFDSWYERPDPPSTSNRLDWRSYLSTIYRRRWLAASVIAVVMSLAIAYSLLATTIYEARAKLLIESQNPNVIGFQQVLDPNTAKLDYYETQLGVLRSRTLARKTIDTLHLWNHPDFNHAERSTRISRALQLLPRVVRDWAGGTGGPRPRKESAEQSRAIDAFLAQLKISYRADNRLFDAAFQSTDPELAAHIANTHARGYIEQNLELKLQAAKDASDWLNARLAEQREAVEASELALQLYREANADVSMAEQQNITVQKLGELSTAATRAKTERIELESVYAQLRAIEGSPTRFGCVADRPFEHVHSAAESGPGESAARTSDTLRTTR